MQSILVPCDFSKPAIDGLHFAVELAQATGATITVMSAVDQRQRDDDPLLSERLREEFENVVINIPQPVQIVHRIRFDKLAHAIGQLLTEQHIDQLVVGTRGSRGWPGVFMGSNVERITRISIVPVFAVRSESHLQDMKRIVFPCDLILKDHYGIMQLKKMQALLKARLHLLWVITSNVAEQNLHLEKLRDYARFHNLADYTINVVKGEDVREGILHFAKEISADLIAMTTHGATDLNHIYGASIAADVINQAHLPTWTCVQHAVSDHAGI